ncbi:MAG TPA: hypothetical protein VG125_04795 [Pirellulales bacterium]|jgi:hypothetical protein|nr:hypothetical protein [Pirellulales bacterium]
MTKKTQKRTKSAKPATKRAKAAAQAAPAKKTNPPKPPGKVYVLFGADEYAKPRAARFSAEDPDLLAKAADAMHLRLVEVTDPDVAEIAATLPAGRLHANGKGLVPYVKGEMYKDLGWAIMGDDAPQAHREPTAQDLPGTWDEVAPGHIVLAREILECGWWEAVVVERTGDLVTVRYRDYPHYGTMVRRRSAIALISAPAP